MKSEYPTSKSHLEQTKDEYPQEQPNNCPQKAYQHKINLFPRTRSIFHQNHILMSFPPGQNLEPSPVLASIRLSRRVVGIESNNKSNYLFIHSFIHHRSNICFAHHNTGMRLVIDTTELGISKWLKVKQYFIVIYCPCRPLTNIAFHSINSPASLFNNPRKHTSTSGLVHVTK